MPQLAQKIINDGSTDNTFVPLLAQQGNTIPTELGTTGVAFNEVRKITHLARRIQSSGNRRVELRALVPVSLADDRIVNITVKCEITIPESADTTSRTQAFTLMRNLLDDSDMIESFTNATPFY